ncbi:MAG: efflux RND transporter periplasmic adaptor subunit [Williamsia sp.]|nr:efflux RND transporter periplasmic adaptor subunit [Williamsia sp.]
MKKYISIAAVLCFAACNHAADHPAPVKQAPKNYELGEVVRASLSASINLPGEIKPFEIVQIYPRVNAFIKDVLVDRGSKVRKGQVLIRLEAPEVEQQYFAARSKYLQVYSLFVASKDSYERLVATSKTAGTVSAHDLMLARSKMLADSATAEGEMANYKGLQATKNYLMVTAPFEGVITERNVHPGALVGPGIKTEGGPMLVLQQEAKLRLVVNIPEAYNNQLAARSAITFHVSTLPGKVFTGFVSRAAGSVDEKYRSEAVEVDVDNRDLRLKPGMSAEVELPVTRSEAPMVVPTSAIVNSTEGKYVIRVADGKAQHVDVQEGNAQHDSTEVFGDIHAGDRIVVHANNEIKPGLAITSTGK